MGSFRSLVVFVVLVVMTHADEFLPPRRILTRDSHPLSLTPYLGYTSYGGGVHPTIRPVYPYNHGRDYTAPLPDTGYALYRGFHHDFRNGGNSFRSSGFLTVFLVSCSTILRTLYNAVI